MSNLPLSGEVALVTGASRGIGAAIADELAARGATVIGTATSDGGAEAIGARLAGAGGHGRKLDVTDAAAVEALASRGMTRVAECGPGKVLTGLVKRIDKALDARVLGTVGDFDSALADWKNS